MQTLGAEQHVGEFLAEERVYIFIFSGRDLGPCSPLKLYARETAFQP